LTIIAISLAPLVACKSSQAVSHSTGDGAETTVPVASAKVRQVIEAAIEQTSYTVGYDPAYTKITYPGGDVPRETGVCTDVIIRAFRKVGVDLQKEVHLDMAANFSAYPNKWGLKKPDTNIDHRRVPNLMTFFKRKGKALAITDNPRDYRPGDVVAWDLGGGVLHVGIVTNLPAGDVERLNFIHNIGWGAKLEDILFSWKIIGHYRYF
jgi:uncharacterized protein YijF (DUF1287 family)